MLPEKSLWQAAVLRTYGKAVSTDKPLQSRPRGSLCGPMSQNCERFELLLVAMKSTTEQQNLIGVRS
jgi:hypothetical protein